MHRSVCEISTNQNNNNNNNNNRNDDIRIKYVKKY